MEYARSVAWAGTSRSTCCSNVEERTADDSAGDGSAATVAATIHIATSPATTLTSAPADASSTRAGPACSAIHNGRPSVDRQGVARCRPRAGSPRR